MAKYEKWLGAGLGLLLTGPIGGLFGFLAGSVVERSSLNSDKAGAVEVSEFEVNLMVLAAHLIKIDGKISLEEIAFTRNFLDAHFDAKLSAQRAQLLNQCLQKEYDLNAASGQIRMYTSQNTRMQVVRFMFDLATCDGKLTEAENFFIFKIAGFLNVHDADFRRIKTDHLSAYTVSANPYSELGAQPSMHISEIRTIYRKLVLKYHPDRNTAASDEERKKLAHKFQLIKEAYQKIKLERGE